MLEKRWLTSFKFLLCIIMGSFYVTGNAQYNSGKDYSSDDIENLINYNPVQSLDIAQLLLSKPNISPKDKAKLIFLIAKAHKAKGNYSSGLTFLYEEKKYADYLSGQEKIEIEIEKIKLLRALSLDRQVEILLKKVVLAIDAIVDSRQKTYLQTAITIEKARNLEKEGEIENSIKLLENLPKSSKSIFANHSDLKTSYLLSLGNLYLKNAEATKAGSFYNQAIICLNAKKNINLYHKTLALSGLAEVYYFQKQYKRALIILSEALSNTKMLTNILLQETVIQQQLNNYLALNDTKKYTENNANYLKKQTQFDSIALEAMNTSYKLISTENSELYAEREDTYFSILYALLFIYVLVILFYVFSRRKQLNIRQNLDEIIRYIEITRDSMFTALPIKNPDAKKYVISKDLEDEILKKLKRFENTRKFVNKEVSLSLLAVQFDTNVKYLSDIISSNYNLNFNAYINTLRINYIIEKLKTEPDFKNYKISYLADYCGFSAHSSFATVFKSITGISPVKFIELLKTEKENTLLQ
jgi:AraC-like DNA-binding protein